MRAALGAGCAAFVIVGAAGAVIGGADDRGSRFANVGLLQFQRAPGQWAGICTGTLVAADVVLTAAHCVDFLQEVGPDGFGPDDLRISFDAALVANPTHSLVDHIVVNPDWFTRQQPSGNSKQGSLASPAEDIALVWLSEDVAGITPAPIASTAYLDTLDLKSESFTVVGYGVDEVITGSFFSNQPSFIVDGVRSYRDVSVIPGQDAFPDRFVKITQSVCFGDSGGPLFHGVTVVGVAVWTFSARCSGPNLEYRLDAPKAQSFLAQHL